ncbi:MAG TPA: methylated-DNA--[protein]-cysteine S-methyltransferase [Rhodoferax sp.]|jgi:methylated-DNA-[protein]-cysteine S-methyltransferase|nr:methylated-DNA--[protein]-cysteine S-methyltransferase [Rhodoferax sp.]HPW29965.1 methylated-DNA--[protein]-cysteine S-methyltransferase [Rhodoferax sp.]
MKKMLAWVRCTLDTPLGTMTLAAHDTGLVWAGFDGQRHAPDTTAWRPSQDHPMLQQANEQLQQYFASERTLFDLVLDLGGGTAFQQAVWKSLLDIAPGTTSSYGTISQRIDKPSAARAVGAAIGRNPISIIVPCHRVVGAHGAMTGYAGGIDRKIALLQLESSI